MKNFRISFLLICFAIVTSCSETTIIEKPADSSVDAPAVTGFFKKRVLIEDYTGTWCGFCTRVSYAIDQVKTITDKAVPVAIYGGRVTEPWLTPNTAVLKNYFFPANPNNYPEVRLNRTELWTNPQPLNLNDAKNLTGNNCGLGLAINSNIVAGNLVVDAKIKLAQTYSNLRIVVYVVENNLVRDQTNYYSAYYGGQNPIPNYVHNHVLKHSLTSVLGETITENTVIGQTIVKNYSVAMPTNISNTAQIGIVAFVIDANDTVVNVRYANINDNQLFEENF